MYTVHIASSQVYESYNIITSTVDRIYILKAYEIVLIQRCHITAMLLLAHPLCMMTPVTMVTSTLPARPTTWDVYTHNIHACTHTHDGKTQEVNINISTTLHTY